MLVQGASRAGRQRQGMSDPAKCYEHGQGCGQGANAPRTGYRGGRLLRAVPWAALGAGGLLCAVRDRFLVKSSVQCVVSGVRQWDACISLGPPVLRQTFCC